MEVLQDLKMGHCRYCGQVRTVFVETEIEDMDEYATLNCDCAEATARRNYIARVDKLDDKINVLFGNLSPEPVCPQIVELLKSAARACSSNALRSVSLNIDGKIKAKVTLTGNDTVKVERKDTNTYSLEE